METSVTLTESTLMPSSKRSPPVRARHKRRLASTPSVHIQDRSGPASFKDVIRLWPNKGFMARDLGVKPSRVEKWFVRDMIPPEFWVAVIQCAERAGFDLIYQDLAALAALNLDPDSVAA
jgi:hypothetical protein